MLVAYYNRTEVVVACGVFVRSAYTCTACLYATHRNFGVSTAMCVDSFFEKLNILHNDFEVESDGVGISFEYLG
jgi:hypothetical protein